MADVLTDGFVAKVVVGGEVFELVVVAVTGVADDTEDENLPVGKAKAAFVFACSGTDFGFKDGEDLVEDFGGGVNVLEGEKNGGEFVAAAGGDLDFFDRNDAEFGLNGEIATHAMIT